MNVKARTRHEDKIALRLCYVGSARCEIRFQARIVVRYHMKAVVCNRCEFRSVDDSILSGNGGPLITAGCPGGEFGIAVMGDRFGVEHIEAGSAARDVNALTRVRDGDVMQFVVLTILEVSRFIVAVPYGAEVREAAIGEQSCRVGSLV